MRLGQLARKLALRPSQIVDYLATRQVFPEEGSNARLSDEVTEQVVLHFAPERLNEIITGEEKGEETITTSATVEVPTANIPTVEAEAVAESVVLPVAEVSEAKPEVIKAPKVELTGLKVLGKIELPEPKKKTTINSEDALNVEEAKSETPVTQKKVTRPDRREKSPNRRESHTPRPARNPVAVQREQKAREEEEKRKARAEREKEKRTQYYLQRVKTGQPTKAARIVSEPTETFELKEVKPAPKTWLGKFLRWLNT
jgi:hypothetical protein